MQFWNGGGRERWHHGRARTPHMALVLRPASPRSYGPLQTGFRIPLHSPPLERVAWLTRTRPLLPRTGCVAVLEHAPNWLTLLSSVAQAAGTAPSGLLVTERLLREMAELV